MDGGRVSTVRKEPSMSTGPDQSAGLKFVVTNTLIVGNIQRSVAFYRDVLGATVLREGSTAEAEGLTISPMSSLRRLEELIASAIHKRSRRAAKAFIRVKLRGNSPLADCF